MKSLPRLPLSLFTAATLAVTPALAQTAPAAKPAETPYKILNTIQVPATGGLDYVFVDSAARRVYVPSGPTVHVFDLEANKEAGTVANATGHGVAIDPDNHHGFVSGNPSVMFDTQTLAQIKTNPAPGADGILFDSFNHRIYIQSHRAPNLLIIDSKDGSVVGKIDAIGKNDTNGATEQGVTDGEGHLYFDVEDQGCVAVVDAKTLKVTAEYDLGEKGAGAAGLAIDTKNHILFAMCRGAQGGQPTCVVLNAKDGKIITTLPLAGSSDGAVFNPATMEAFSSHGNGTLSVIKENSPTDFTVEQTVQTKSGAKTCALDTKTNHVVVITTEAAPAPAAPAAASASASGSAPAAASTPAVASGSAAASDASGGRGGRGGRGGNNGGPRTLDVIVVGH